MLQGRAFQDTSTSNAERLLALSRLGALPGSEFEEEILRLDHFIQQMSVKVQLFLKNKAGHD